MYLVIGINWLASTLLTLHTGMTCVMLIWEKTPSFSFFWWLSSELVNLTNHCLSLPWHRSGKDPYFWIVRHSSPRHSSPQTFITSDVHHPLPKIRHSSPRTFITSDVHHLRHSSPQTFITSDIHHPLPKIRHSSPQTFITSSPRGWWMSEVMNVWGDECLNLGRGWWTSEVMNVWF